MFDSLLNSKFYNKCKHAFKCIRTRMAPIRRKKHAMIRFLKKDVADLLGNGLDTHAFGRMDGLIVELNHASCYDMIEGFCDYIGKQLGSLQKQRECPPEFREAVSTLIFAAARYPDLPELCDLRHIFKERYGNFVDHFVSQEFIRKLDSTEFTNKERFQVMQSVAEELSVSFDAKELQLKLWATPETEHDVLEKSSGKPAELAMPLFDKTKCDGDAPFERENKDMLENHSIKPVELATASSNEEKVTGDVPCKRNYDAEPAHNTEKVEIQLIQKDIQAIADAHHTIDENSRKQQPDVCDEKEHSQKPVSPVDTNRRNTQKDVQKLNRRAVRPLEKELMEAVELDLNGLPKDGFGAVKFPETEGSKTVQLNVKPNEAVRDYHIEKENNEVLHGSHMPGGPEHNSRHADSGLRAQRPNNQGRPVSPLSGNTRNKAPHTKRNVSNMKNPTEKQANNGFLHDEPQNLADLGHPVQKGQGVPERAVTILPPYVKPKSNTQPVSDDPEKQTPSGYSKPNVPGQTDHLENKDVLRPVSVRRRTAKLPATVDAYVEVPNNEKVTSQTPKSHRSPSSRQNGAKYDQNRKCNVTDDVGRGTNAQITPSSQSKHIGRRNAAINHNDNGSLMHRRQPEADETAIDFGNLLPNGAKYDQNRKCNVTDDVGRGTNAQITPSSKSKHICRRNGAINHNDNGRLMQRRQPEADETAIDFGNLLPRNANGQRRHNSGRSGDLDEEERMMDKLLMHYSKKRSDPTNNEADIGAVQNVSLHPPGRAISLPPESVGPGEDAKVPARSTSLQPDGPRSVHVHPKMPDFDELAARVKALRKA